MGEKNLAKILGTVKIAAETTLGVVNPSNTCTYAGMYVLAYTDSSAFFFLFHVRGTRSKIAGDRVWSKTLDLA